MFWSVRASFLHMSCIPWQVSCAWALLALVWALPPALPWAPGSPDPTASSMINVNCPFCTDDFLPAAELAPVAFDVAGDPMSCHGQTSDQFASAERRQNQVAAGSGFASLLKH